MVSLLVDEGAAPRDGITTDAIGNAVLAWHLGDTTAEYNALRTACGLIDQAAGGPIRVSGSAAAEALQAALTRDVEFLPPERALTSLLLDTDGSIVDVVVVIAGEDDYLVLTGPGASGRVEKTLVAAAAELIDVEIVDESADTAVFSAEGPTAWRLLADVAGPDYTGLGLDNALPITVDGTDAIIARLGVTGEFGYTFVAPTAVARQLWDAFVAAGGVPVGHQARETAMLEVRQPVVHRETLPGDTVLTAGLNWLVEQSKEEFVGRDALGASVEASTPTDPRPIGFTVTSGRVALGEELFVGGERVGTVTLVVDSPGLGTQLGLARVDGTWQAARLEFTSADGAVAATLAPPYVVPASWSVAIKV